MRGSILTLVSDHFRAFQAAYEERFAATYGDWRPVAREVERARGLRLRFYALACSAGLFDQLTSARGNELDRAWFDQ